MEDPFEVRYMSTIIYEERYVTIIIYEELAQGIRIQHGAGGYCMTLELARL